MLIFSLAGPRSRFAVQAAVPSTSCTLRLPTNPHKTSSLTSCHSSSVPFKVRTLDDSSPSRKWTDELMNPSEPDCLKKNTFKEEKCQDVIYALYDCCQAFYDRNGDDAKSASCPKPDLLRLKLRMRKKDKAGDNSQ